MKGNSDPNISVWDHFSFGDYKWLYHYCYPITGLEFTSELNCHSETSNFPGVVTLTKKKKSLFHSHFFPNVSLCEKVFLGQCASGEVRQFDHYVELASKHSMFPGHLVSTFCEHWTVALHGHAFILCLSLVFPDSTAPVFMSTKTSIKKVLCACHLNEMTT